MNTTMEEEMECRAKKLGISIEKGEMELLKEFQEITQKTNFRFNLVSRKGSPKMVIINQIMDSLLIQPIVKMVRPKRALDIGSGGGFPGIPLSILNSQINFNFMDSSRKRFNHLLNVKIKLRLINSNPIHGRVEDLAKIPQYRESYDLITAKSVANISTLVEWVQPLLKPKGVLVTTIGEGKAVELWELMAGRIGKGVQIRCLDGGVEEKRRNSLILVKQSS